jgi:hypothetical protein
VPTSVLLAVLAAAGLLALAPALTRRYDATERVAAERAMSTARVLTRRRRRRTVPGSRPINPPRFMGVTRGGVSVSGARVARSSDYQSGEPRQSTVAQPGQSRTASDLGLPSPRVSNESRSGSARSGSAWSSPSASSRGGSLSRGGSSLGGSSRGGSLSRGGSWSRGAPKGRGGARRRPSRRRPVSTALHRRRRVLLALVLLNLVELAGVMLVGPGFWVGFSVSFVVLVADMVYLRQRAVAAARLRRARQRQTHRVAAQQAAVRREHDRRAAQRLAALRRAAAEREGARREAARHATEYVERYTPRTARGW